MERRRFLAWLATAGAAVAAGAAGWLVWPRRHQRMPARQGVQRRPVFPPRYARTLRAMAMRLLPAAGRMPGAKQLHVFNYIEAAVRRRDMQGAHATLLRGAVQLDRLTRARASVTFADASGIDQDGVIRAMLAGQGAGPRFVPKDFVRLMLGLCLEGAFGDPSYGGNPQELGWRTIGYRMYPPRPGSCGLRGEACAGGAEP